MFRLEAKKSLGQHFLVDENYHKRIVAAIAPNSDDVVIEIGPGTGLLTKHLVASPLKKLIAFEVDKRAVPQLREALEDAADRVDIVEQDFLEANLHELAAREGKKLRVAGNIPYNISSPIIFKLIDDRAVVRDATLLIQLEVAERLTASPRTKAYGIPTVLANFFGEAKLLFKVPAGAFRPVPRVVSAVVQINFERDYFSRSGLLRPSDFDDAGFRKLVRGMFAMRRKTLRNNLKAIYSEDILPKIEASAIASFLNARAEELTIEQFLELHRVISAPT
jgi:16S rRNA (adenine1518-N6/adenine1519-N6)-dimethyltransferase